MLTDLLDTRLSQNFNLLKKKKKNPLFAKCNKRRYACITLIFHSIEDLIKTTELGGINLFHR